MDKYEIAPAGTADSAKYEEILKSYASNAHTVYDMNDNPLWFNSEGRPWSHAEAKYELNGQMYLGGWCSPQNDGPALRSVVLMRFADRYTELHPEDTSYVKENLYSSSTDVGVKNPIKRDLEFLFQKPVLVATNPDRYTGYWDSDNCEPWEEVSGKHFYNRLMARRAMSRGAAFASAQGDAAAAASYSSIVSEIESAVESHWNASVGTIRPTNNDNRFDDAQTVFGTLHSHSEDDGFYGPTDSKVLANAQYTLKSFADYFAVNGIGYGDQPLSLGLAIGRYTGDVYNGGCNYSPADCPAPCLGQPWFLSTNMFAELFYRAIAEWTKEGSVSIDATSAPLFEFFNLKMGEGTYRAGSGEYAEILTVLVHAADSFLQRTQFHSSSSYRLDEQYNGVSGVQMSAGDLVWSYASLVTAKAARDKVDPAALLPTLTGNGKTVLQQFIVSDYDATQGDASLSVYRLVGDVAALGGGNVCAPDYAARTPSQRRCSGGKCDYSMVVEIPRDVEITWQMARTNEDCSAFELSQSTQVISATNNGLEVTTASWVAH